jgi:hypothetical protein
MSAPDPFCRHPPRSCPPNLVPSSFLRSTYIPYVVSTSVSGLVESPIKTSDFPPPMSVLDRIICLISFMLQMLVLKNPPFSRPCVSSALCPECHPPGGIPQNRKGVRPSLTVRHLVVARVYAIRWWVGRLPTSNPLERMVGRTAAGTQEGPSGGECEHPDGVSKWQGLDRFEPPRSAPQKSQDGGLLPVCQSAASWICGSAPWLGSVPGRTTSLELTPLTYGECTRKEGGPCHPATALRTFRRGSKPARGIDPVVRGQRHLRQRTGDDSTRANDEARGG